MKQAKKNKYQVSFFPSGAMEDFLSEKTLWVEAETEDEAKAKATKKIEVENKGNYRADNPLVIKMG